jgi:hypothetical protein
MVTHNIPVMIPAGATNNTGGSLPTTLLPGEQAVKNLAVSGTHIVTKDIPKTAQTAKYKTASIMTSKIKNIYKV